MVNMCRKVEKINGVYSVIDEGERGKMVCVCVWWCVVPPTREIIFNIYIFATYVGKVSCADKGVI